MFDTTAPNNEPQLFEAVGSSVEVFAFLIFSGTEKGSESLALLLIPRLEPLFGLVFVGLILTSEGAPGCLLGITTSSSSDD